MDVMPNVNIEELFDKIVENVRVEDVYARVDDAKEDYVWDWEDEFDDIEDAYYEKGRGQAESSVVNGIISEYAPSDMDSDDQVILYEILLEHWELSDE